VTIAILFLWGEAAIAQIIIIRARDTSTGCEASVDGGRFQPGGDAAEILAQLKRSHPHATIGIDATIYTPWRCVGGLMTDAARAHFDKVTFTAAPPDDQ